MRITCAQQNLARGIGAVKSVVPNKSSLPSTHVPSTREGVRTATSDRRDGPVFGALTNGKANDTIPYALRKRLER
jgi:hypothetical protein